MSLLSRFRKKPQDAAPETGDFQSRAEGESSELRNPSTRTKRKSTRQVNEPIDPMLPEKKRARRRLVGAVALVLAAVIGLPMILDAEQKPLGDDVVIQIPSRDQAPSSATNTSGDRNARVAANTALDPSEEVVNPSALAAKNDAAANASAKINSTGSQTSSKQAAAASPAATAAPAVSAESDATNPSANTASVKPSSTHTESHPAEKKESPPAHKQATKIASTDIHHPDSARAQSILDGGVSPAKKEKKNAKVIVQVAALASKEKVSELQDKLKAAGITSFTQTVATDSGTRIRVRIGPFDNKEEADAARGKLSRLGLNGTLVPS